MPKAEWGAKHICQSCGAKFYDILQSPPTCPSCGAVIKLETKRKTSPVAEKKKAKNDKIADEDEVEEIDDDPDEDLLPDDEEEDDDGIGDVGVGVGKLSDEDEQET